MKPHHVNAKVLHIFCLVTCPSPVHACSRCRREMLATSEKSKKHVFERLEQTEERYPSCCLRLK
jgi:hypothetical protein